MSKDLKNDGPGLPIARLLTQIEPASMLSIINALREGIIALDADLHILTMNPAAEEILGRSRLELAGVKVCDLFGNKSCPEDVLEESLFSGEAIIDFQTTVQLADGHRGHVLLRTSN